MQALAFSIFGFKGSHNPNLQTKKKNKNENKNVLNTVLVSPGIS